MQHKIKLRMLQQNQKIVHQPPHQIQVLQHPLMAILTRFLIQQHHRITRQIKM